MNGRKCGARRGTQVFRVPPFAHRSRLGPELESLFRILVWQAFRSRRSQPLASLTQFAGPPPV